MDRDSRMYAQLLNETAYCTAGSEWKSQEFSKRMSLFWKRQFYKSPNAIVQCFQTEHVAGYVYETMSKVFFLNMYEQYQKNELQDFCSSAAAPK